MKHLSIIFVNGSCCVTLNKDIYKILLCMKPTRLVNELNESTQTRVGLISNCHVVVKIHHPCKVRHWAHLSTYKEIPFPLDYVILLLILLCIIPCRHCTIDLKNATCLLHVRWKSRDNKFKNVYAHNYLTATSRNCYSFMHFSSSSRKN